MALEIMLASKEVITSVTLKFFFFCFFFCLLSWHGLIYIIKKNFTWNGFSGECVAKWDFKLCERLNDWSQWLQTKGLSTVVLLLIISFSFGVCGVGRWVWCSCCCCCGGGGLSFNREEIDVDVVALSSFHVAVNGWFWCCTVITINIFVYLVWRFIFM